MRQHTISGKELLAMLASFPSDVYPDGITEDGNTILLDGKPIEKEESINVWSCTGDQDLAAFDSDWNVERL